MIRTSKFKFSFQGLHLIRYLTQIMLKHDIFLHSYQLAQLSTQIMIGENHWHELIWCHFQFSLIVLFFEWNTKNIIWLPCIFHIAVYQWLNKNMASARVEDWINFCLLTTGTCSQPLNFLHWIFFLLSMCYPLIVTHW